MVQADGLNKEGKVHQAVNPEAFALEERFHAFGTELSYMPGVIKGLPKFQKKEPGKKKHHIIWEYQDQAPVWLQNPQDLLQNLFRLMDMLNDIKQETMVYRFRLETQPGDVPTDDLQLVMSAGFQTLPCDVNAQTLLV